jgi:hypothetical protein
MTTLPTPLVEAKWLASCLDDPDLRILDATVHVKLLPFPRVASGKRGKLEGRGVRLAGEHVGSTNLVDAALLRLR